MLSLLYISCLTINLKGEAMDKILFFGGPWNCFSNFSAFKVLWAKIEWMTSEHAYQAAKFVHDKKIFEEVRNAPSAYESKKLAQNYKDHIRPDWYEVKLQIMEEIVRAKLEQHKYIQRKILETGDLEIIEDSPYDDFWGRGPEWKGENHLGKIWMKLRTELKTKIRNCNHECICNCHQEPNITHIRACCYQCEICKRNIPWELKNEHLKYCHLIKETKK